MISDLIADELRQLVDDATTYMSYLAKEKVQESVLSTAGQLPEPVNVGLEVEGFSIQRVRSELGRVRYHRYIITSDLLSLHDGLKLRIRANEGQSWETPLN
jgi:hypothetical protein